MRTLVHSAWTSLLADFESSLASLKEARRRVEQAASIEHMYATDIIRTEQGSEMLRQEKYRRGKYICFQINFKPQQISVLAIS